MTRLAQLLAVSLLGCAVLAGCGPEAAPPPARVDTTPRTADGKPDLSGIWQALGTAHWNLLDHAPGPATQAEAGAIGAIPGGVGVVQGNEIPYLPAAAEQQKKNFANRLAEDPEGKCYLPGVPRANYLPFPFQIVQTPKDVFIAYEFANADRLINMGEPSEAPLPTWMGWSNGRWDGDTLVVDVTGLNGMAWLDRAGNYASDAAHVVERYTLIDEDHMRYEATIEDPTVFSRAWTISLPLYRRVDANAQLVEFRCVEFVEEKLYGQYRKVQSE
jgi:hypothetical protein